MAKIKVLNLDDSYSLSELSYEDTKTINGGAIRTYIRTRSLTRAVASYISARRRGKSFRTALAASLSTPS